MTIEGTIKHITGETWVTDRLKKRELWLELPDGNVKQVISIEFTQGWADLLNDYQVDDFVMVHFNLRGRIYKEKVYNSLSGFKIEGGEKPLPF